MQAPGKMNSFNPVFINLIDLHVTSDIQVQLNLESDRDHLTAARAAASLGNSWKTQEKNGLINCHNHCVNCVYIVVGMYFAIHMYRAKV